MTPLDYVAFVRATNTTANGIRGGLDYAVQKLCAEAGEVAQLRAREHLAGNAPAPLAGGGSTMRRAQYALELGDLAWYIFEVCALLDLTFEDVLELNRVKLERRAAVGKNPTAEQIAAEHFLKSPIV